MKLKLHGMTGLLLSIAGSCALLQSAQAQFTDTDRDLILTFRKTGFDGSGTVGTVVFEVDIGQASIYYGATPGSTFPITAYSATSQLGTLFDNLNDLSWSIGACVPNAGDSGSPSKPKSTLWLTDPWSGPGTPAPAWVRKSSFAQGQTDSKVQSVLDNAKTYSATVAANSVTNSPTAVAIPYGSVYNANGSLGGNGNYLGNFQGDVENTTSSIFIYLGTPSDSEFYELQPGSGNGTDLGYFELGTDGSMTFYAASAVVTYPAPKLSISNDNAGHALISFQSTSGGTYTLHYTSAAGLTTPVSSWSTASPTITGDGTVKTFQQSISGTATVYSVSVH